jgi:hypothetical protein
MQLRFSAPHSCGVVHFEVLTMQNPPAPIPVAYSVVDVFWFGFFLRSHLHDTRLGNESPNSMYGDTMQALVDIAEGRETMVDSDTEYRLALEKDNPNTTEYSSAAISFQQGRHRAKHQAIAEFLVQQLHISRNQ